MFNKLKNSQENDVLCLFLADNLVKYLMSSPNKTRNSAIADKPRDALVQYAVGWLTPNKLIPHMLPLQLWSMYVKVVSISMGTQKVNVRWGPPLG